MTQGRHNACVQRVDISLLTYDTEGSLLIWRNCGIVSGHHSC